MSTCFVCLNKARRKVCPMCECYAHNKCWGEYLQNTTKARTAIVPGKVIVFTPWSAPCPQCRGRIMAVKPVTRSDTSLGRRVAMAIDYSSFLSALDDVRSEEERFALYTDVLDMLTANKTAVRQNNVLTSILKSRLRSLYVDEGWLAANLYYHQLFGTQIAGSS